MNNCHKRMLIYILKINKAVDSIVTIDFIITIVNTL